MSDPSFPVSDAPPEPAPNRNAHDPRDRVDPLCTMKHCPEPRRCLTFGCQQQQQPR